MTRTTIFEGNINNNLWPGFFLIIIYAKNNWPTRALLDLSPNKAAIHKLFDLFHI